MKLENQVVSLELSKQLKEAGYEQSGLWWWNIWGDNVGRPFLSHSKGGLVEDMTPYLFVAPTVAELGERLPEIVNYHKSCEGTKDFMLCYIDYRDFLHETRDENEANARAKMWLYLKKEGLL